MGRSLQSQSKVKNDSKQLIKGVFDKIRTAKENKNLAVRINSFDEVEQEVSNIEPKLIEIAQSLCPEWAIQRLLQAIGEVYYGGLDKYVEVGPPMKYAVACFEKANAISFGTEQNIGKLIELVRLSTIVCNLYFMRLLFAAYPNFSCTLDNTGVHFPPEFNQEVNKYMLMTSGRGKRLRIADTNTQLMLMHAERFFDALNQVRNGKPPKKIPLFKGTFYEKVPGMEHAECKKFWEELYDRFYLLIHTGAITQDEVKVALLEESDFSFSTGSIVNSIWNAEWFNGNHRENYSELLVERPVVRIASTGKYATSFVLIGDSINKFVEKQLLRYPSRYPSLNIPECVFKESFSEEFENRCIQLFRNNGFLAGHIKESGAWIHQKGTVSLCFSNEKILGEVDVFAYHPGTGEAFLVECKVLLDVTSARSYRNIISKLRDDSEKFRTKLHKKAEWVNKAINIYFKKEIQLRKVIVTDIPMPILNSNTSDISLWDYQLMEIMLDKSDCGEKIRKILKNQWGLI